MSKQDEQPGQGGKARKKKVTAAYLERAALHYLGRFSSSEKNLRDVLIRKIRRRNESHSPPTNEQLAWVETVVSKCVRYGYVNDESYAMQRAELMLRRGKPVRSIRQDLRHKGIDDLVMGRVLEALDDGKDVGADRRAAAAYIRRRKFGAFRRPVSDAGLLEAKEEKELAAMARAGFGYSLARELLSLGQEEISDLLA